MALTSTGTSLIPQECTHVSHSITLTFDLALRRFRGFVLDDKVMGEQSRGHSYVFILNLRVFILLIICCNYDYLALRYRGGYPFWDCTCARGILVPVWALAPNTPLQTGACPISVTCLWCFSRGSGFINI